MSMESPSCMSDSLLAMEMAVYLKFINMMHQPLHTQKSNSFMEVEALEERN